MYARVVAKRPRRKAVAVGHAMRKLLHLVFAVWKTGKPFDPTHYRWDAPAHVAGSDNPLSPPSPPPLKEQAAGLKPDVPARTEVTAACDEILPELDASDDGLFVDFAHLKQQLPISRVLEHLGITLRGRGSQRRCACPIHRADGRGRTFSVELDKQVFHCFEAQCGAKGDIIDLWAALHHLSLRQAALDLVRTFGLEPSPGTEKRHG